MHYVFYTLYILASQWIKITTDSNGETNVSSDVLLTDTFRQIIIIMIFTSTNVDAVSNRSCNYTPTLWIIG